MSLQPPPHQDEPQTPDAAARSRDVDQHNGAETDASTRAHRVIAALNRDQVDFLDKLGKDALFSCGSKLSRTEILSAMVNVLRQLNVNAEGVSTGSELEARLLDAIRAMDNGGRGDSRHE